MYVAEEADDSGVGIGAVAKLEAVAFGAYKVDEVGGGGSDGSDCGGIIAPALEGNNCDDVDDNDDDAMEFE